MIIISQINEQTKETINDLMSNGEKDAEKAIKITDVNLIKKS
jgi:hypothetical protein